MNDSAIRKLLLISTLVGIIGIQACGDYATSLPGHYSLVRVYSGAVLISNPEHVVVINPNVESYKVIDGLVVGYVTAPEYLSPEEKAVSKPGYFVLNTKTREVQQGLNKTMWLDTLRLLDVKSEPLLNKPSRFDKNY